MRKQIFSIGKLDFRKKKDVLAVRDVLIDSFSRPPWNWEVPPRETMSILNRWKNLAKKHNAKVFVARTEEGKIVGFAAGHLCKELFSNEEWFKKLGDGKHYYLEMTGVLPDLQGQGIAKLLGKAREAHARQLRCKTIVGETVDENLAGIELFKKRGFTNFYQKHWMKKL